MKYEGLKDDCFNHGILIYDRLHNNETPVDIAFVGSSHTVNGIDDELISRQLKGQHLQVVNFGYCRLGRNLHYVLIKEIIKTKRPAQIVIEVREDENRYGHPIFPYVADAKDVFMATPFFNRDYFADIFIHLSYKTEIIQDILFHPGEEVPFLKQDFGFASSLDTASVLRLEQENAKIKDISQNTVSRNFYMKYPRTYIRKITRLCEENHVKIVFLYLPAYGSNFKKPPEYDFYQSFGNVWIAPDSILTNPANWHDHDHLNRAGAGKLSLWIAHKIQ